MTTSQFVIVSKRLPAHIGRRPEESGERPYRRAPGDTRIASVAERRNVFPGEAMKDGSQASSCRGGIHLFLILPHEGQSIQPMQPRTDYQSVCHRSKTVSFSMPCGVHCSTSEAPQGRPTWYNRLPADAEAAASTGAFSPPAKRLALLGFGAMVGAGFPMRRHRRENPPHKRLHQLGQKRREDGGQYLLHGFTPSLPVGGRAFVAAPSLSRRSPGRRIFRSPLDRSAPARRALFGFQGARPGVPASRPRPVGVAALFWAAA